MMIKFCSPLKRRIKFLICTKKKKFMGALNPNLTPKFTILNDLHYAFRTLNEQKNLKLILIILNGQDKREKHVSAQYWKRLMRRFQISTHNICFHLIMY